MKLAALAKSERRPAVPESKAVGRETTEIVTREVLGALRRYVASRVPVDARDDVVSDVLLRLTVKQAALESARNPIAWMRRVTRNAIADHYRQTARDARNFMFDSSTDTDAIETPAMADEESLDLSACVAPPLRGLPARYSDAVRLSDLDGLNQLEAASRLGISRSAMRSSVLRCWAIYRGRRPAHLNWVCRRMRM